MRREYFLGWSWSWALRRGVISIHCWQVGRRGGISVRRQVQKILDHSCWTIGGKMKNKVTRPISDNLNKSGWGWTNFCSLSGNIRSLGLGTVVEHSTCYVTKKGQPCNSFLGLSILQQKDLIEAISGGDFLWKDFRVEINQLCKTARSRNLTRAAVALMGEDCWKE